VRLEEERSDELTMYYHYNSDTPSQSFYDSIRSSQCHRVSDKQKWAKAKLFVAAALSMIDMFTDILMMVDFIREKKMGFAYTM